MFNQHKITSLKGILNLSVHTSSYPGIWHKRGISDNYCLGMCRIFVIHATQWHYNYKILKEMMKQWFWFILMTCIYYMSLSMASNSWICCLCRYLVHSKRVIHLFGTIEIQNERALQLTALLELCFYSWWSLFAYLLIVPHEKYIADLKAFKQLVNYFGYIISMNKSWSF